MAASSSTNQPANLRPTSRRRALGLMSGTSLDGIDVAAIATDGEKRIEAGPAMTLPYPDAFRERLRGVLGGVGAVAEVEAELTRLHAEAVAEFRRRHANVPYDLIGFHG